MIIDNTLVQQHEAEIAKAKAWKVQHTTWKNGTTASKTLAAANLQIERMGAVVAALLKDKFDVTE